MCLESLLPPPPSSPPARPEPPWARTSLPPARRLSFAPLRPRSRRAPFFSPLRSLSIRPSPAPAPSPSPGLFECTFLPSCVVLLPSAAPARLPSFRCLFPTCLFSPARLVVAPLPAGRPAALGTTSRGFCPPASRSRCPLASPARVSFPTPARLARPAPRRVQTSALCHYSPRSEQTKARRRGAKRGRQGDERADVARGAVLRGARRRVVRILAPHA